MQALSVVLLEHVALLPHRRLAVLENVVMMLTKRHMHHLPLPLLALAPYLSLLALPSLVGVVSHTQAPCLSVTTLQWSWVVS